MDVRTRYGAFGIIYQKDNARTVATCLGCLGRALPVVLQSFQSYFTRPAGRIRLLARRYCKRQEILSRFRRSGGTTTIQAFVGKLLRRRSNQSIGMEQTATCGVISGSEHGAGIGER